MSKKKWDTMPYNGNFGFAISEEYKGEKIIPFKIPTFFGNQFEFLKEKLTQEELWKLALLINSLKGEQNKKIIEESDFDNEQKENWFDEMEEAEKRKEHEEWAESKLKGEQE